MPSVSPALPAEFQIPPNFGVAFKLFATGTETYHCNSESYWQFVEAEADLHDKKGKLVAEHRIFDTPDNEEGIASFEYKDESFVNADPMVDVPPVIESSENNLSKILLEITTKSENGKFSNVEYILRMNPKGLYPTSECTEDEIEVIPYTAEYWFLEPK